uniref:Uncharacterized protein n=1 Tax=Siphoviridae sp. ctDEW4 TaxID=2823569 RepID=A0A8S5L7L7_9CAUD|nr:MAG TPA: protein of unknown function DUF4397 [Siphoviridae sp. ctDEW4]
MIKSEPRTRGADKSAVRFIHLFPDCCSLSPPRFL